MRTRRASTVTFPSVFWTSSSRWAPTRCGWRGTAPISSRSAWHRSPKATRCCGPPAEFGTLTEAPGPGGIDLVDVCFPTGMHAATALEALTAGVHVLVEKPVDVSLPEARRLAAAAEDAAHRGVLCGVVSQHR